VGGQCLPLPFAARRPYQNPDKKDEPRRMPRQEEQTRTPKKMTPRRARRTRRGETRELAGLGPTTVARRPRRAATTAIPPRNEDLRGDADALCHRRATTCCSSTRSGARDAAGARPPPLRNGWPTVGSASMVRPVCRRPDDRAGAATKVAGGDRHARPSAEKVQASRTSSTT